MTPDKAKLDLKAVWWLWLPLVPLAVQLTASWMMTDRALYKSLFLGESGVIEVLTVLVLLPAIWFAWRSATWLWRDGNRIAGGLLYVFAFGCFMLAGEEMSWGHHIFQWTPPEYFLENNRSGETNWHNLEGSNRSEMKWALVWAMLLAGAVAPFLVKLTGKLFYSPRRWFAWLAPTIVCLPVSIIVFVGHVAYKHARKTGAMPEVASPDLRLAETIELYIALFFALYAASLWFRLRQVAQRDAVWATDDKARQDIKTEPANVDLT